MTNAYDLSSGLFSRALTNLKSQLTKAEAHAAASGTSTAVLLNAQLDARGIGNSAPNDVHAYTLAAQVHWAAEGARLAIARLLGEPAVPTPLSAESFPELHERIDATVARLRDVASADLEAGLDREIVVTHRHGSVTASGDKFLRAYAIPHFFYHVSSAYGIMRNQGVPLTMGDYLGNWGAS